MYIASSTDKSRAELRASPKYFVKTKKPYYSRNLNAPLLEPIVIRYRVALLATILILDTLAYPNFDYKKAL